MSILGGVLIAFQFFLVAYFAVLNVLYAFFGYLGLRSVMLYAREMSDAALKDLLERDFFKPVSILVPAYNEEASIVASVRASLGLQHPAFEVIVAADGCTDRTVERLIEEFALTEVQQVYRRALESAPIRRILRSLREPNLLVVDKDNGGKADALNAALNLASYPLVCAVDADSLLDGDALLRATRLFAEDDDVVALGGTVRPLNGSVMDGGSIAELHAPRRWIERFQVLEYTRAFFTGRAGWSRMGALLIISGAFGVFRRAAVLEIGGYRTDTVGEDMELVVRLHKQARLQGRKARVVMTPDPICRTEVPSDLRTLRRQRNRWQRGLWETLLTHNDMLFNRRFGRLGMIGVPYFWFFEGLAPIFEVLGYVAFGISAATGALSPTLAIMFLLLAVLYGMLLSQLAVGIETLLLARYARMRDRLVLLAAAFFEFLGYRQLLSIERLRAMFQVRRKRGAWGEMKRTGVPSGSRRS